MAKKNEALSDFVGLIERQHDLLKRASLRDSHANWLVAEGGEQVLNKDWPEWRDNWKDPKVRRHDRRAVESSRSVSERISLMNGTSCERLDPNVHVWRRAQYAASFMISLHAYEHAARRAIREIVGKSCSAAVIPLILSAWNGHGNSLYTRRRGNYADTWELENVLVQPDIEY